MWANYHTHSHYCDGKGSMVEIAAEAALQDIRSLGFSSHAPVPFECKWCMPGDRLGQYVQEIEEARKQYPNLEIYRSLESDYIPNMISPNDFTDITDYTLGSIHFVDNYADGRPWEIDGQHQGFLEGLNAIFKGDIRAAVIRYFELTREMVEITRPDIIGHLDKIKIQNIDQKFYNEQDSWYRDEIHRTLKCISKNGGIIEVNTRGIYQKKSATTYPAPWILTQIFEMNIPVTISSDAHVKSDLTNQFPETAKLLYECGFRKLSVLSDFEWKALPFDEHGIQF